MRIFTVPSLRPSPSAVVEGLGADSAVVVVAVDTMGVEDTTTAVVVAIITAVVVDIIMAVVVVAVPVAFTPSLACNHQYMACCGCCW